ncbi:MAG: hypothetical protein UW24_C0001G0004 [Parcubacteria group bacterium GW2011_GWA2_44_12]|nr:MAG: hypothetical protein UW24_C0001G0004 [Parcubacteria group bacterium GW2011_GWA2_44_12]
MFLLYIRAFLSYAYGEANITDMPLKYFILLIIAVCNIAWAFFIWLRNPKDKINIFFGAMVLMVAFWTGVNALDPWMQSAYSAVMMNRMGFLSGTLIIFFFFVFSHYFPYEAKYLRQNFIVQAMFAVICMIYIIFSDFLITGAYLRDGVWVYDYNMAGFVLYGFYLLFYTSYSFGNLLWYVLRVRGVMSQRVIHVLLGTGLAIIFSVVTNFLLPKWGYNTFWIGPYSALFMMGYISYNVFYKSS